MSDESIELDPTRDVESEEVIDVPPRRRTLPPPPPRPRGNPTNEEVGGRVAD